MKILLLLLLFCTSCASNTEKQIIDYNKINNSVPDIKTKESICLDKINTVNQELNVDYDARLKLLFSAKGSPVLFVNEPVFVDNDIAVQKYRAQFEGGNPWLFIDKNISFLKSRPQIGRGIFLRYSDPELNSGYLHTENADDALVFSHLSRLDLLFKEHIVYVERAGIRMKAERRADRYYFITGPFAEQEATIILWDKLGTEQNDSSDYLDFSVLRNKYGFKSINPTHMDSKHIVAEVKFYDDIQSEWLLDTELNLICETKDTLKSRTNNIGLSNFRSAILANVVDGIPFDEPKHEFDQEDGELRNAWMLGFSRTRTKYRYTNELISEINPVYNRLGKAIPPQVCIDFLVDSIDRASGSWYTDINKRKHPSKTQGAFDSGTFRYKDGDEEKKYFMRTIEGFKKFAEDHSEYFEIKHIDGGPQMSKPEFMQYMIGLNLKIGDMVFVKGFVPWDTKEHSHSFIIYEVDPISGMPTLLAGNAGTSSLRPWKMETTRTPKRRIHMVISPKQELLQLMNNIEYTELIPR